MLQTLLERFLPHKEKEDADIVTFAEHWLTPTLRNTLASLHGTPDEVVEGVIQLLPLGSRTALTTTKPALAVEVERRSGRRYLELTPFGSEVIAFLASHNDLVSHHVEEQLSASDPTGAAALTEAAPGATCQPSSESRY